MKKGLIILFVLISISSYSQCEKIEKKIDKYTDDITWKTPLILVPANYDSPVQFSKVAYPNDTMYVIALSCQSKHLSYGTKGVYILFYNGKKIIRETQPVDVMVNNDLSYTYTAVFELKKEELAILRSSTIEDFRLSAFNASLGDERYQYKDLVRCLIAAK